MFQIKNKSISASFRTFHHAAAPHGVGKGWLAPALTLHDRQPFYTVLARTRMAEKDSAERALPNREKPECRPRSGFFVADKKKI
ncbi:hypothetical protein I5L79_05910 [Hymenobacter sp. BT594]|uniref:Uncharacterized protein n=1 Tax=Hymenobacter guriensis TaxID=2793065 RepID=A0ABS0KYZ0_9BACT|nr:hypothetical protein [Hymenobacter guriensis]